ncbi:MAG: ABC transporter permease [Pirellulales bacterium]|jgi:putative ABC transport system permease protein|nr:ABC transporter permease [Thermoguttaceae bacterium]MDD4787703.1 ABC transporter permease [Pirellulales bacterium]MDI9446089.1 ABC transporter permease [Planctomycetota bacterium]NLZ00374.1 FtsX-like permease family protein [Pirellulaceae bacterium]
MAILITLRIALRALAKNKLRAGLTVLGVVIGIAAVTTMVSIGQSANDLVLGEFHALGTNVIVVFPSSARQGGVHFGSGSRPTLTPGDADAIATHCDAVLAASPIVGSRAQLVYGNSNWSPRELVGVGTNYLVVRNWEVHRGGFFTDRDIASAAKVCVIGQTIVGKLFQTTNPIGQTIRIKNIPFEVIGVLEAKGANLVGDDQDNIVMAPYTTVRKRLQGSNFSNVDVVLASARSTELMGEAEQQIRQLLLERHRIPPGQRADFEVKNTTEIANVLRTITGTMTALLASIAGISLLVGGVGIMNIMLVSVTERTREIGIRLAVGARSSDILWQFLVEAILLSAIGGLVGFLLGWGASTGITMLINSFTSGTKWPIVVSFKAALIAILFSTGVGIFFGFFPALRASRMDPIEALRYE